MPRLLCILLLILGAAIHVNNLYRYRNILQYIRQQTYEINVFSHWVYWFFFHVQLLLFAGHLFIAAMVAFREFHPFILLVAALFLLFSLFALCMVRSIQKMNKIISEGPFDIINALIVSIEAKDPYTMGHSKHVMQLCELVYEELPGEQRKRINLQMLKDAALLHDIGKLRIPDRILQKPGKLNEDEMTLIRHHPKFGYDMLAHSSFCHISIWVLYHHERADGCGYYRIPADKVPIEAKILAVADTYSALSTDRSYQNHREYSQAIDIMTDVAGTQLDAAIVDVFCQINREKVDRVAPQIGLDASIINTQGGRRSVH